MESMFGKFPLANRPKMTRRKRKNVNLTNLTPGASNTTSTGGTRRGGSSPTTEPLSNAAPSTSSASQSPTTSRSGAGPQRTTRGIRQGRKRGGNPYDWLPPNDHPSSPTTDETLPITPRSDMSSTFSVSSTPPLSFRQSQSPVIRRRNAVSAGPYDTGFGSPSGASSSSTVPIGTPLFPNHTWPMSTTEEAQHFLAPASGGFIHTQSEGALGHYNPTLGQHTNVEYLLEAAQAAVPLDPNQQGCLMNYPTSLSQPSHSFNQPFNSRAGSSFLAEQTFPSQDFTPTYPPGSLAQHYPVTLNDGFTQPPIAFTGHSGAPPTAYNGSYSGANEINQMSLFDPSNPYIPPMPDLNATYLQSISPSTGRGSIQSEQDSFSLASQAFGHNHLDTMN